MLILSLWPFTLVDAASTESCNGGRGAVTEFCGLCVSFHADDHVQMAH